MGLLKQLFCMHTKVSDSFGVYSKKEGNDNLVIQWEGERCVDCYKYWHKERVKKIERNYYDPLDFK
ncbi:hypothetical protein FP74_gp201 [Bacillus phage CAM003]|uniref:Uncharacterized protein n=2 Tax=Bastillevirus CAM003 TaxID=1918012 RepID=A0A024AZI9_9CAUD|nr:hypothetical protein FP74_gp201 [Bacillus phage CAM003]AHZ09595.1 hypothetical protein [Bacillus phage CAM003]ASR79785.1 hypothetical protein JANET_167 [Bacillus phage Janet]ASU01012.1 hypothetical protein ANTHONY_172 [Bacillus phage Anthony]